MFIKPHIGTLGLGIHMGSNLASCFLGPSRPHTPLLREASGPRKHPAAGPANPKDIRAAAGRFRRLGTLTQSIKVHVAI